MGIPFNFSKAFFLSLEDFILTATKPIDLMFITQDSFYAGLGFLARLLLVFFQ